MVLHIQSHNTPIAAVVLVYSQQRIFPHNCLPHLAAFRTEVELSQAYGDLQMIVHLWWCEHRATNWISKPQLRSILSVCECRYAHCQFWIVEVPNNAKLLEISGNPWEFCAGFISTASPSSRCETHWRDTLTLYSCCFCIDRITLPVRISPTFARWLDLLVQLLSLSKDQSHCW